ncbi:MAG: hypothetical protein ABEK00_03485 [Candidatus Nanohaloarchaea archaeon]
METDKFKERKRLEAEVEKLDRDVDAAIVEGLSDKIALRRLGFKSKIFLSAERTVEDLVEDVSRGADRAVILTDFDEPGKQQHREISQALNQEIDVLHDSRKEFGALLTSSGRRTIEAVHPLLEDRDRKFVEAQLSALHLDF